MSTALNSVSDQLKQKRYLYLKIEPPPLMRIEYCHRLLALSLENALGHVTRVRKFQTIAIHMVIPDRGFKCKPGNISKSCNLDTERNKSSLALACISIR